MFTPQVYGINFAAVPPGKASSAYYWFGLDQTGPGSFQKLANLVGGQVEAGWLSGQITGAPSAASNLTTRRVVTYGVVYLPTRFSDSPGALFHPFVGLRGPARAVFPRFGTWQVFGPPANAA